VPVADRALGHLQPWLIGTYHGVSREPLPVDLEEFVFRHHRRRLPRASFETLLGLGTGRKPRHYKQIRARRTFPSPTPTHWGFPKQPDKQKAASPEELVQRASRWAACVSTQNPGCNFV
jgi:hypothetical protein